MLERIWRKGNTPTLLVGRHNGAAAMKTIWRFLQKLKLELAWNLAIPLLGRYPDKAFLVSEISCFTFCQYPEIPKIIYFPTNSVGGFLFLHSPSSIYYL